MEAMENPWRRGLESRRVGWEILVVMDRRRAHRPVLLGLMAALAVLLSSCGGSGFKYVGSSEDKTYFKVPIDWTEYNKQQLLVATGLDKSQDSQSSYHFLMGFDSDPNPEIDHVANATAVTRYPVILAWVRKLDFIDHETYSLTSVRNSFYRLDALSQNHAAEVLSVKDLSLPGGFHGEQIVYDITGGNFTIAEGNVVLRVAQIGLLDPGTNFFYMFILRCSADCYTQNQSLIDQIVNSFTVKEQ